MIDSSCSSTDDFSRGAWVLGLRTSRRDSETRLRRLRCAKSWETSSTARAERRQRYQQHERPIKILFVGVNPDDTPLLDLPGEAETIQVSLSRSKFRDRFELVQRREDRGTSPAGAENLN